MPFDVNVVPEVQNAQGGARPRPQSEFNRIQSLLEQRVVSQSEFDQRRTQMEAARQQYEAAKNGGRAAVSGAAGRARARRRWRTRRSPTPSCERRSRVSSPSGWSSVGDYVTKGTKVAVVVRVNPLRVAADRPRAVRRRGGGRPAGRVRGRRLSGPARSKARSAIVSPALEANQRALTVEAIVANPAASSSLASSRPRASSSRPDAGCSCRRRGSDRRRHEPGVRRQRRSRRRADRHGRPDRRRACRNHQWLKAGERRRDARTCRSSRDGIEAVDF